MHVWLCFWQADSGFFCEGCSSDEDVLMKEEFRGNIIKQGCLLKQVKQKAALQEAAASVCKAPHLLKYTVVFSPIGKNNTAMLRR